MQIRTDRRLGPQPRRVCGLAERRAGSAALSGHSQSHINRQLKKLLAIGVIERTAVLGPHGRGRAWHLSVKHTPQTQALAKALFAGAAGAETRKG